MTTKRLLDDVNILKKGNEKSETRKRNREVSGDDDMAASLLDGSVSEGQTYIRRESTASARLSYSSTSSSSSSQSSWTDLREDDVPLLEALECVVGSEALACEVNDETNTALAGEKSSLSDIQAYGVNQYDESLLRNVEVDRIESTILIYDDEVTDNLQHPKSSNILPRNERWTRHNKKEESPLDTSFESELTPANTTNSSDSNSSSVLSRATRSSSRSNT
jgi:hypothetical protein